MFFSALSERRVLKIGIAGGAGGREGNGSFARGPWQARDTDLIAMSDYKRLS